MPASNAFVMMIKLWIPPTSSRICMIDQSMLALETLNGCMQVITTACMLYGVVLHLVTWVSGSSCVCPS
jgi:hypothetical protein